MPLVVTHNGMKAILNAAFRGVPFVPSVGLYQNAWEPTVNSAIGEVVPCNFSGYTGLSVFSVWDAPVADGLVEKIGSPALIWTRGAGNVSNWVVGYYVVDAGGVLLWAESSPRGSFGMTNAGNIYSVTPAFCVGSRYGGV